MLGSHEPFYRRGCLDRRGRRSLWCGDVSDLANLAGLFVGGLRVPVRECVRRQRAYRQDKRDRQHTPDCYSLRYTQTRPSPRPYCS